MTKQFVLFLMLLACLVAGRANALTISVNDYSPSTDISNELMPYVSLSQVTATAGSTTLNFNNPVMTGTTEWYGGAQTKDYLAMTQFNQDLWDLSAGDTASDSNLHAVGVTFNTPVSYFGFTGFCSQCDIPDVFLFDGVHTPVLHNTGFVFSTVTCTANCGGYTGYTRFSYGINLSGLSVSQIVFASSGSSYIDSITVPEPKTLSLLIIGLVGLWSVKKRKRE